MKKIIINIKKCSDCPHLTHTGMFTDGGAKPCCKHTETVKKMGGDCFKRIVPYKSGFVGENMGLSFHYPSNIPEWCPLPDNSFTDTSIIERTTLENINNLTENQIFVFGSNLAGKHGKGAAKTALLWGAKYGQEKGLQGRTYAIPTKDATIRRTLTIEEIKPFVDDFIEYAINHQNLTFLVTKIGCGLAGLKPEEVAPLFRDAINVFNIHLPSRFWENLSNGV